MLHQRFANATQVSWKFENMKTNQMTLTYLSKFSCKVCMFYSIIVLNQTPTFGCRPENGHLKYMCSKDMAYELRN